MREGFAGAALVGTAMQNAPQREAQVINQLNQLDREISALGEIAERLVQNLTPVLRAQPPRAEACAKEVREVLCPIADTLYERVHQLRNIRESLLSASERLEV